MAQKSPTRTIVWTGNRWIDQETGVYASNLRPPTDEPSQPSDVHLDDAAFQSARSLLGDQDAIVALIERTLTEKTIPSHPAYSFEGHWLVTYEWLRIQVAPLERDIRDLRREIAALKRPWWKRWFSR